MLFTEEVVIKNPGAQSGEDSLGNPIFAPPTEHTVLVWYEERTSTEALDAREQRVWGYWIYTPLDAPLRADSIVVIEGEDYSVVGMPGRQPGGFIVPGYIHASLERTTG